MKHVIIDDEWQLQIKSTDVTLMQTSTNEQGKTTFNTRGYYAHVDEALKAYLRKCISPNQEVIECLDQMETALTKINNIKVK